MSLRQPPKARNVLWAEDGGIFLQQSLEHGGANAFAPYEGYLHVLPRIAAALTAAITPPAAYALTMNLLSCLVVALIAGMVFHCAHQVEDRIYVRLASASIVILIGAGPLETTGNFANLHWYLLFLAPWVLTTRAETKSGAVLLFVVGALTATTEILAAIFVPMMLLRWRDRTYWPPRIGLILGFACQFIATITSPRSDNTSEPLSLESIVIGWFVNGAGVIVYGTGSQLGSVVANFGWIALTAAFLPFLAAFVFILWKGVPRHRLMAIAMLSGSVIVWAAIQIVNPAPSFDYAEFSAGQWRQVFPSRYAVPTSMFVMGLVPIVLSVLPRPSTAARGAVVAVFMTLQVATFFPSYTARLDGPSWQESVTQAAESCSSQVAGGTAALPIAPVGWFADELVISCDKLLR